MKKQKPLIEINPYLENPKKYRKVLILIAASSNRDRDRRLLKSIVKTLAGKGKRKQAKKSRGTTT